jgi:excisionase family DNA binding protein
MRQKRRPRVERWITTEVWPFDGTNGVLPANQRVYLSNPPKRGKDFVRHYRRGRWHWWERLPSSALLSQSEAAAHLSVSRSFVSRLVREGKLRAVSLLGTSKIRLAEVEKLRKKRKAKVRRGSEHTIYLVG